MQTTSDQNFATLQGADAYVRYFNQLAYAFTHLTACYRTQVENKNYEALMVTEFLKRILYTIEVLRMRYTYRAAGERKLWIDVTESGFPNASELNNLAVDLATRDSRLAALTPNIVLKESLVESLVKHLEESEELLYRLSERAYLEMLHEKRVLLPFTPGELQLRSENHESRAYVSSWACHDFQSNRPYIHIMTFEQDAKARPLHEKGEALEQFMEVLKGEGSRAPNLAVLALLIDDAIESVHPKILKRICLGPLYSQLMFDGQNPNYLDPTEMALRGVFTAHSQNDDDYVFFFSDEIIFSKRQETSRSLLAPQGKVREVFAIRESDPECYERGVSVVHHFALLPHSLLQHLDKYTLQNIPLLHRAHKYTVGEGGEVYEL